MRTSLPNTKKRPVYITGVGAVSPFGETWEATWRHLLECGTAIGPIDVFDARGFPCQVAAPIRRVPIDQPDRRLIFARQAAEEAWSMARPTAAPHRCGVFIGAESGRARFHAVLALSRAAGGGDVFDHQAFGCSATQLSSHVGASAVSPAAVASQLAQLFNIQGPAVTISVACSSGAAAIVEGTRAVRNGACDVALCGGVGADVDPLMLAGFGLLGALSERGACCPFDQKRDGFVVGEGAAMVVLEATARGGNIAVTGAGRTLDGYHLTKPAPQGQGAARAMEAALEQAQLDCVDYIQAHGTSTLLNDQAEAEAIVSVFGKHATTIPISSVKGALGHWVAGAGALGLLCAVESLRTGALLPTVGLVNPDVDCKLEHIMGSVRHKDVRNALVNAFAFGGANASIVLESVP